MVILDELCRPCVVEGVPSGMVDRQYEILWRLVRLKTSHNKALVLSILDCHRPPM